MTQSVEAPKVAVRLVPVEVFGVGCPDCCCTTETFICPNCKTKHPHGFGLMDAVSCWSDCNRAAGHIYRFDEDWSTRDPGDSLTIWVDADEYAAFTTRRWGTPPAVK